MSELIQRLNDRDAQVGVIGLGRQGRAIIAELSGIEGVTIGAICDTDDRRLRAGERSARDAA